MASRAVVLVGASKAIRVLGYSWAGAVTLLHVVGLVAVFVDAETWWQGFVAVGWAMSPWNFWGYIVLVVAALPAVAAISLAETLERRAMRAEYTAQIEQSRAG